MSRKSFPEPSRRGSILALMIIAMVLMTVVGIGMLQCGQQARVFAARTSNRIAAQAAADAGLINAIWGLNQDAQARYFANELPQQTDRDLANSFATYSYELTLPDGSDPQNPDPEEGEEVADPLNVKLPFTRRYTIKCVGKSGGAEKTLYATVRLKGLFESALLSMGRIDLMPNTLITGYNSADPADTEIDVKIGTMSVGAEKIYLGPGTVVDADVFVGVGGDPDQVLDLSGTITGQQFALTEQIKLPVITVPDLTNYGTDITARGATVAFTPDNSGTYSQIDLSAQAGFPGVLEIDGGDVALHITGDIDLGNDAEIIVRNGSSLTIYADGDIAMGNSAGFLNENVSAKTLKIFATGDELQSFELKAKSSVFGIVYAPNADVALYPNAELYGAISANNISIKSGGTFYYDEALKDVDPDDEGARFVIERWWE